MHLTELVTAPVLIAVKVFCLRHQVQAHPDFCRAHPVPGGGATDGAAQGAVTLR